MAYGTFCHAVHTMRSGKWRRKTMLYSLSASIAISLFVCKSIHQGHGRFSDVSRGKQWSLMSLSTLLSGRVFPVQLWTSKTVDNILMKGDNICTCRWPYSRCRVRAISERSANRCLLVTEPVCWIEHCPSGVVYWLFLAVPSANAFFLILLILLIFYIN